MTEKGGIPGVPPFFHVSVPRRSIYFDRGRRT